MNVDEVDKNYILAFMQYRYPETGYTSIEEFTLSPTTTGNIYVGCNVHTDTWTFTREYYDNVVCYIASMVRDEKLKELLK